MPTPAPQPRRVVPNDFKLHNKTIARHYPDLQTLVDKILAEQFPGERPRWRDVDGDGVVDAEDLVMGVRAPARGDRRAAIRCAGWCRSSA